MNTSKVDAKRILELIDPVTWLRINTGFNAWKHEAELLRDWTIKTRVVRKARQVGVTTTIAHEAVWKAFTKPGGLILIVSPSLRQSKMVMEITQSTISSRRHLSAQVLRNSKTELQLKNGSSVVATPNNPDRIRGYTANDIYLDEAAHFSNDESVMRAIRPMLSATQGYFTVISTPVGKQGLFWEQYKIATSRESNDAKAYEFHPSTISPLITPEYMKNERRNHTELEFKQEYLAEFIEETDVYLPMDLIQRCVSSESPLIDEGKSPKVFVIGIDLAKKQDETIAIVLERTDERELIVRHIDAWSHMDYTEQIGRIGQIARKFEMSGAAVDQTGVGEPIMEELKKTIPTITGVNFTQQSKFDLASWLRSTMEHKKLLIPNNKRLILQLNSVRYNVSKSEHIIFQAPPNKHDDHFWALALAVYASRHLSPYAGGRLPITRSF